MSQRLGITMVENNAGGIGTTFRWPQNQLQGQSGITVDNPVRNGAGSCARGFRLTIRVYKNVGSAGSLTPSVQEVVKIQSVDGQGLPLNQAVQGHTWTKSAAITAGGIYTMTVHPGLTPAAGGDDVFNDVLGYEFMVVMTHGNANKMLYDAFIDLLD